LWLFSDFKTYGIANRIDVTNDEKKILFVSYEGTNRDADVIELDLPTLTTFNITKTFDYPKQNAIYSPDETKVLFSEYGTTWYTDPLNLFSINRNGTGRTGFAPLGTNGQYQSFNYSLDGKQFIYIWETGWTDLKPYIVNADGTGNHEFVVSTGGNAMLWDSPCGFKPDGSQIYIVRKNMTQLVTCSPNGNVIQVIDTLGHETFNELIWVYSSYESRAIDSLKTANIILQSKLSAVQKSIDSIKNNCCKTTKALTIPLDNNGALLYQNAPNPFNQNTVIKYFVPYESKQSFLYVYDLKGTQLRSYNLNKGDCNVTIYGNELIAGIYLYSLVVDGKMVDTKQMILTE